MPNSCVKAYKFLFPAVFLVVCPVIPVFTGETVEFDSGLVPGSGGEYLNLWRNAGSGHSSFYWDDSLVPTGPYDQVGPSYWDGPYYVHRSDSLDGNTIIVYGGLVKGSVFGALDETLDSDPRPHDVTNNRIIIHDGIVGYRPGIYYGPEGTTGNVFGGWTRAGDALNNRVEIY